MTLVPETNMYLKVAHTISDLLSGLSSKSSIEIKNLFKSTSRLDLNLDYDKFSDSFTKEYWLRNYWKAVYFFEYESHPITIDLGRQSVIEILVLGAGSAAYTIACMVWLSKTSKTKRKISITLADRSQKQLELARRLINRVKNEIGNVNFDINYKKVDIKNWSLTANSVDLVLMSHFLTENPEELGSLLENVKLAVREKAQVIIIERQKDKIWQKTRSVFMDMGIPVFDMKIYKDNLINLFSLEDDKSDLLTMTPHYVLARLPEDKYQIEIIAKYFQAWRGQSTELLTEIFQKNAKYYEKPMVDNPFKGLGSIKEYWEDNPLSQRKIQVKPKRLGYESGYIMSEFGADFDTPKQHIDIQGVMVFDIDRKTKLIKELREYFNTVKRPFGVIQ